MFLKLDKKTPKPAVVVVAEVGFAEQTELQKIILEYPTSKQYYWNTLHQNNNIGISYIIIIILEYPTQ